MIKSDKNSSIPDKAVSEDFESDIENQQKFERLIARIATDFVVLPSSRIDDEIAKTQKLICEYLGIHNSVLYMLNDPPRGLQTLHSYKQPGVGQIPEGKNVIDLLPWSFEQIFNKKAVIFAPVSDAPPEARIDKESCAAANIDYGLMFPLFVGGLDVFGALSFSGKAEGWVWTNELLNRLKLVSQIFASAISRKKADDALRESDLRLTLAAESANAGLWSIDSNLNLIWTTDKNRQIHGLSLSGTITGDDFINSLHPDDRTRIVDIMAKIVLDGTITESIYRVITAENTVRWISIHAQGFLESSGEPGIVMGVSRDITRQVENEHALSELRLELEHVTRVMTLNELSTSLAHEINQPLGAILNNASAALMLLPQTEAQNEIREIFMDVVQDSKRAGDVIRKTRGIAAKNELKITSLCVNSLINEVIALLQSTLNLQNIQIVLNLDNDDCRVSGDRIRLQQVLMNFMTNAIAAIQTKSVKTISINSSLQSPEKVVVSVSDSGDGIEDSQLEKIFEAFFTTKYNGLGMGLAICKSIVEEHGGRVWADNKPDGGAVFSLSLDVAPNNHRMI